MKTKECPLCGAKIAFGRVYLLFSNGRLWPVDAAIGHLADSHNFPIPLDLISDVLGQGILLDDQIATPIFQQEPVDWPETFSEGKQRTVRTNFSIPWDLAVNRALTRMYGERISLNSM